MNKLSMPERAAIIRGLVEGTSVRAIGRMTGHSKGAVLRLLVEVGEFCAIYQHHTLTNLPCKRVEVDEVWGNCGAKEKNKTKEGQGDLWTFTAICADSKLILSWLVGNRDRETAHSFMQDVAARLRNRVQLTTDGHSMYLSAVENAFGWNGCDFAQLVKKYGTESGMSGRYGTPEVCIGADKVAVFGSPDMTNVSTSFVERANLSIRMGMRRMTRASNGFSKKADNHAHAFAIHMMHYNYCRSHQTLTQNAKGIKTTPAMAAGLTDRVWTVEEIFSLMDPTRLLH
jgi:IS1 family transposase